jgi:transposase
MKMFIEAGDIYLHLEAVDFRKSINGLVVGLNSNLNCRP